MFYGLVLGFYVLIYLGDIMETIFPDVTQQTPDKNVLKKKQTLVKERGTSDNFYMEVRIDVLKNIYREVIYQIEKRTKVEFPNTRLDFMNEHRLQNETKLNQEDPKQQELEYLNKKKAQIVEAINDHYDHVADDDKDDLEIAGGNEDEVVFNKLKTLENYKVQEKISQDH